MRYLMTFSYDGSLFYGYQKQPNLRTIEGELENALTYINGGKEVIVHSSGRTDKKVHALNQKAHFDLGKEIPLYKLKSAINRYIGNDIYVKAVECISSDFHARYMVKRKEYVYKINIGEYNPIDRNYIYQYNKFLDVDKMRTEIKDLIGTHDFSSFANMEDKKESYVRTIYDASIKQEDNIVYISFIGDGFLKYQVRNMVGCLIECSTRNRKIKKVLDNKDRTSFGKIAPPEGLYLTNVEY